MRFSTTNLCAEDATVITASSSNVNFPVSNLKNPFRSRRWRSAGNFEIDSTNNKIDFKEASGGSVITCTLSTGSYTVASLAAAIKSAMEFGGANNYTVSFSTTTGLWTISSDGLYFALLNHTGTNQANALFKNALGFPDSDKTGALTYTGSLIAIHTKEYVIFDLQTAQDIKNVAVLWPREDGIQLSDSAVVKLEANPTNVWTSPAVSQTLTISDTYVQTGHFFSTAQSYRYWRITIQDSQNPNLYVDLGQVWIGEDLGIDPPENGFKYNLVDQSKVTRNDFGHEYVDEYPQVAQIEFDYKVMYYVDLQTLDNAFRENGTKYPVLICLDETSTLFDKDHFLIYGKMEKSFSGAHVSYNLFNSGLKITEIG